MRGFYLARKVVDGKMTNETWENAQLPMYMSENAAGADFFSAVDVKIRSYKVEGHKPTLIHTGIKACMEKDVCLKLYNRSSNPKRGLILANSVGIIDADYFENESNDGEIMFAFINMSDSDIDIKAGDRIGQGIFEPYLRPTEGLRVNSAERTGGFGSTGK